MLFRLKNAEFEKCQSKDDSTNALSTKELTSLLDARFLNDVTAGPVEVAKHLIECTGLG
jgi:hypothetical protein